MHSISHALNIGTLATWLSVAVFGVVAVLVPDFQAAPVLRVEEQIPRIAEDFTLGDLGDDAPEAAEKSDDEGAPQDEVASLPAPPELPEIAEFSPLPEIPEIPRQATTLAVVTAPTPARAVRQAAAGPVSARRNPTARTGSSAAGAVSSNAAADASRLAQGRMPAPVYPAAARRGGQTGTVLVEFTVDSSGRVISAVAKSPSPWPLLNAEAVRTVRKWRFPPGGIMKLQRPIVFQLR